MLHEIRFLSTNDRDYVQGWVYVPASKVKGIVQIVHGFGEHSRRYFHMIVRFMEAGYIVAANDHVGHGKTAIVNDTWGDWGDKGYQTMMEDEHKFQKEVQALYPEYPYFMFGHSMGSLIARDFITKYGNELAGVTLCGTIGSDSFPTAQVKANLIGVLESGGGKDNDPNLLVSLMGHMYGRCKEEIKLGNEWICCDPYVQTDHANDPFDAFTKPITNQSVYDFIEMIDAVVTLDWATKVPIDLPIYNIGGDQDPVGSFGKGIYECSNWLCDTGHTVKTKVYSGYRHEIHNYTDIRNEVEQGIIDFMDGVLENK